MSPIVPTIVLESSSSVRSRLLKKSTVPSYTSTVLSKFGSLYDMNENMPLWVSKSQNPAIDEQSPGNDVA